MTKRPYHLVGLTGGVGAGKSLVAQIFSRANIPVLNLDDIGRKVSDIPAVRKELTRLTGLSGSGPDRALLREKLFSDADLRNAVERYLHPLILAEFRRQAAQIAARGAKIVVCEAALLVESGYFRDMDELIVVTAPEPSRKQRLVVRDKISQALASRIIASQASDAEKIVHATHVVENDGEPSHLEATVERLVSGWKKRGLLS